MSGAVVFRLVSHYTIRDAARILKVSPARLRYWERTELVRVQRSAGRATQLEFRDLVCVRGILALLDQGVPLQRIRQNVEILRSRLPDLDDPTGSLRLWAEGSQRMVIRHEGTLEQPDGQMVLDFGVGSVVDEAVTPLVSEDAISSQDLDRAEECFRRGCELDGDPATYAAALDAYREAIELYAEFADCHCNLGAVHFNRNDRATARRCFERCLEIDPLHVEANFNLANLLEEDGCDQMALQHYRAALESDPLYPDLHINLALLYEKLGARRRASEHWQRYLQLDPDGTWADVARQRLERDR